MRHIDVALRAVSLFQHATLAMGLIAFSFVVHRREARRNLVVRALSDRLVSLGPTYIKLGQLLSTRPDLVDRPTLQRLERLRDRLPVIPITQVHALMQRELGANWRDRFAEFDPIPVASASIASVYRARLSSGRVVAVKVRRPGIARRIESDLHILRWCARSLERIPRFRFLPLHDVVEELALCLVRQTDFRREAAANERLSRALVWEPGVLIPTLVHELCTDSILTMDFLDHFGQASQATRPDRQSLLVALRALYRMIFVEGCIHCDLHKGNLQFLPGGRVGMIDFGFVADISRGDRLRFAEFFYAMSANDGRRCAEITTEMASFVPHDLASSAFEAEISALVSSVAQMRAGAFELGTFAWRLFDLQRRYRIRGTTAFTMVILSLLAFEGLAREVFPDLDFQAEARPFILRCSIRPRDRYDAFTPVSAVTAQ